jgi:lipopolysaccharide/colanic/teichoic acid biosynthesis glycosyltransferase
VASEHTASALRHLDGIPDRLPAGSVLGYSRFTSVAAPHQAQPAPSRQRVRADLKLRTQDDREIRPQQDERKTRPQMVGEELFKETLRRERKRADRSHQPLVLLMIARDDRTGTGSSGTWAAAMAAVAAAKRETDVQGWLASQAVIGVILTEVSAVDASLARQLEGRIRRELAKRFDHDAALRFSIQFHVHPGPDATLAEGLLPLDPLLEQLQTPDDGTTFQNAMKRALDVTGSLVLLTVLSPLLCVIAAVAKLKSPGPVFFKQTRVGQKAAPFTMLKFRTMRVDADHAIHHAFVSQLINAGGGPSTSQTGLFKIVDDPRVTPVGRILRKTSLDELPQLLNVLRGDMSLVGPRPPLPYEVEQYKPWHVRRVLEAKPGITGLWQVTGRSRTTFDDMVRLDLRYARSCSFWTDVKILLATPAAVIKGKGAC